MLKQVYLKDKEKEISKQCKIITVAKILIFKFFLRIEYLRDDPSICCNDFYGNTEVSKTNKLLFKEK
jgi:hypothetical protein